MVHVESAASPPSPRRIWGAEAASSSTSPHMSQESLETYVDSEDVEVNESSWLLGPTDKIHRYDVGIRLLQFILLFWCLSGISFLTCVVLCLLVNIGYVSFQSTGDKIIVVIGFLFFSYILFSFLWSLAKTFVRIVRSIAREKFGGGEKDFILLRWVDTLGHWLVDHCYPSCANETKEAWFDVLKTILLIVIVLGVFGVPLLYVAVRFGYWGVVSVICSTLSIISAACIVFINIICRVRRMFRFLWSVSFDKTYQGELKLYRMRSAYIASTGNDHASNFVNVFAVRAIGIVALVLVLSFVFSNFAINTPLWIFLCLTLLVLVIIRFRNLLVCCFCCRCCSKRQEDHFLTEDDDAIVSSPYYSGKNIFPVLLVLFGRIILMFLGFMSLIYLDMNQVRTLDDQGNGMKDRLTTQRTTDLIWSVVLFYISTILKDLSFFVPLPFEFLRPVLLFLFEIARLGFAFIGNYYLIASYTFRTILLLAVVELNFREGRFHWKCPDTKRQYSKREKRAIKNTFLIMALMITVILCALFSGLIVGSTQAGEDLPIKDIFKDVHISTLSSTVEQPILCSSRYSSDLSIIDLATMSAAAYDLNTVDALRTVEYNPRLRGWRVGSYSLDSGRKKPGNNDSESIATVTGLRYIEFIHESSDVSVLSIRGTNKLEDVFQDMYLWFTTWLLQISSYLGTFFSVWPLDTAAYVVYLINLLAANPNMIYFGEMEQITRRILEVKNGDRNKVVLTGHSLGAGIAMVTGGRLNTQALGFSGPGLGYSTYSFDVSLDSLRAFTTNIVPMYDPVPAFDKQISSVHQIDCTARQPIQCHSLNRALTQLVSQCGLQK